MKLFAVALSMGLIATSAEHAVAQRVRGSAPPKELKDSSKAIPAEARPPKGMCRIWIDGVAAAQQPAPTDCASAVKSHPANSRVIFGDDFTDSGKVDPKKAKLPPTVKGFTEVKPPVVIPRRPPQ